MMLKGHLRLFILTSICASFIGCTDTTSVQTSQHTQSPDAQTSRTSGVTCVCVGMENSKRFGTCAGCRLDSSRMAEFLTKTYGYSVTLLQSEQATRKAVTDAMRSAILQTPVDGLFIFYYSGHGGQENLSGCNTSEPEGSDAYDEYLCLYDTYLLDDEIWELISACRGRVFLCFDACHSQTLFRSISGDIARENGLALPQESTIRMVKSQGFRFYPRALPLEAGTLNMLCWSGCLEKEYSYGSRLGGVMTTAILNSWESGISYVHLWSRVGTCVNKEQPGQHPYSTQYGTGFSEAFR